MAIDTRHPRDIRADIRRGAITGVTAGLGASSSSFWCRRWILHSRSPSAITRPCVSASTWISMWRGRSRSFSM